MKIPLFQAILLGVFVLSAVIGLFVFATYTTKSENDKIGAVLVWGTLPKEGVQAAIAAINQLETGLKNVSYEEKDPKALVADLSSAIATGAAPDLILASQEELYGLSKFIEPIPLSTLSIRAFLDTFVEGANLYLVPGSLGYYGIPFLVDPLVLFSNRPILASSGIAKPPSTWEALIGLVPNVALLTPSRQITRGLIAFGAYDNVNNARGILSSLFLQTGIPVTSYTSSGTLAADLGVNSSADSGEVQPGRAVLGFYTQFADPSKVSYTWNVSLPTSERMFLTGDLALYPAYASRARHLRGANPNLNFDAAPLPQPATAAVKRVYGLFYAFMVPRGARNPSGAFQATAILTSQVGQATAALHTGLAPATLGELARIPGDPIAAVAYRSALYSSGWLSPPVVEVDRIFSGMIRDVISGRSSITVALASAERALGALFQQ